MRELDLRLQPPRGPREQLDGLVFMPRTIDKLRASLPGGNLGPYNVAPGLSETLLKIIGVDLEELRDIVKAANSENDIAAWLSDNADTSQYERANALLSGLRNEDVPQEHRGRFESLYPDYLLARHRVLFDLLEADDRELYPILEREKRYV